MLSVDVEAFEMRSRTAPLDRLIWGRFPEGDFGLERLMTIAEAQGAPLAMFLDYPEYYAYGEGLLDVGREIAKRGHDLNLHLHLDCIPPGYFSERGLPEGGNLNTFGDDAARALVSDVVELHGRVSSAPASALRGGGYRYNGALLRALSAVGVPISSNYNQAAKLQPFDLGARRQFRWETGTIELPVATQTGFLKRSYATHFNFNIGPLIGVDEATALANAAAFLEQFYRQHGEDAVAVFVMHSWSFLRMDAAGEFSTVNEGAPERLAALLASWAKWAEFVTPRDVLALSRQGTLPIDGPFAIPSSAQPISVGGAEEPPSSSPPLCAICRTPATDFVDYNGPKRRCPSCGSTERQRVFVDVYTRLSAEGRDLAGKGVLVVAPGVAEKRYLKERGVTWKSLDIRPEVKADITADLCDLSSVPDASFDAVIASFVLTCVHDLNACLSELARILRPGGRLLTCDPLRFGEPTVEHQDLSRITAWYGQEAYDKYRVGTFRSFGDADLKRTLEAHGFTVEQVDGLDAPTSSRWVWYVSTKEARAATGATLGSAEVRALEQRVALLEQELQRQRQIAATLSAQLERAQNTLSFRLGYLLLHAPKSWAALRRLPADLWALHQDAKLRRAGQRSNRGNKAPPATQGTSIHTEEVLAAASQLLLAEGADAALAYVEKEGRDARERAAALSRLAKEARAAEPRAAARLAQRAHELEPSPARTKALAFAQFDCGELSSPAALLATLPSDLVLKPSEHERMAEIRGLAEARARQPEVPARARRPAYSPVARRCLYLSASAQPYHLSGYTVRTHALVQAIRDGGFDVVAALRPGYPEDRGIRVAERSHDHGGVTYHHVKGPHARRTPFHRYVEEGAAGVVELATRARPQVIHAASNYVNALPALVAARRLGVPFVYEVRGMWELTAATRHQDWEQTERFALARDLEALVAREADLVLTLTEGLSQDLAARGVSPERLAVVPNAVDPSLFAPRPRDERLRARYELEPDTFALVYAGSLLGYEGLDDALRAVARLVREGVDARMVIAGDGEAREALSQLALELDLQGRVKLLGRVSPEEVPELWSIADVAAFPRKPFKVCELVSPLKPLEPMTMGIPVVVSSVAALREMVRDGETGLVHRAGDSEDLAGKLAELQRDAGKRLALGRAARAAVLRDRTWQAAGARVVSLYEGLTGASSRVSANSAVVEGPEARA